MKKLNLIWIIGILLALPLVSASTTLHNVSFATVSEDDFHTCTCDINAGASGKLECGNAETCVWNTQMPNATNTNWSLHLYDYSSIVSTSGWTSGFILQESNSSTPGTSPTWYFGNEGGAFQFYIPANWYNIGSFGITYDIEVRQYQNNTVQVYIDGVLKIHQQISRLWQTWWLVDSYSTTTVEMTGFAIEDLTPSAAASPTINNTKPSITISYPANGSKINNGTLYPPKINGTTAIQNSSIYNITINSTEWHNYGNATRFNFTFNGSFVDFTHWYLNLTANSTDGNQTSAIVYFTFDITNPTFQSNIDNNYTLVYAYQNFTFNLNFSDDNQIWSWNVTTPEGYLRNGTGLDTTKYLFNGSINVSDYGIGNHTITAWTCDAHTDLQITDYYFEKIVLDSKLIYDTGSKSDIVIQLKSSTATLNDFNTYKDINKYIFWYNFNEKEDKTLYTHTFEVSAASLIYLPDSSYAAHFIANDKNWIDFEFGDSKAIYKVTEIQPNRYEVEIRTAKTSLNFESIGDLNCADKSWRFYIYNYTAHYTSTIVETTTDEIILQLDFKDISLNGTASLFYEGVEYGGLTNTTAPGQWNFTINFAVPSVSGNSTDAVFLFSLDLNDTIYSKFNTTSWIQVVSRIQIVKCPNSLTNVAVLNISFYDEENPTTLLQANTQSLFQVWTNDSTNFLNFTFDIVKQTNYSICMFPNTTLNINSQMFYNTSGGYIQRWFLRGGRLTTNTTKLSIYGTPQRTGYDDLRGILRTTSFGTYPGIYTSLQRFYTSENVWRTVQKDLSDDYGQVNFNIIESTEDYRLLFFSDYTLIDETNSLKFLCDTNNICNVNFIVEATSITSTPNLVFYSGYDNNTEIYQLNWTDGTGLTSSVRLWLTQQTGTGSTTICDTTVASSSGTINCDTTGYGGTLKAQIYSSASDELAKIIEIIYKAVDKFWQTAGLNPFETGFWGYGIMATLVMGAAMYSIIFALIIMIFAFVVLYFFGLVNFISIPIITLIMVLIFAVAFVIRRNK